VRDVIVLRPRDEHTHDAHSPAERRKKQKQSEDADRHLKNQIGFFESDESEHSSFVAVKVSLFPESDINCGFLFQFPLGFFTTTAISALFLAMWLAGKKPRQLTPG
jgi:hypothetical protein